MFGFFITMAVGGVLAGSKIKENIDNNKCKKIHYNNKYRTYIDSKGRMRSVDTDKMVNWKIDKNGDEVLVESPVYGYEKVIYNKDRDERLKREREEINKWNDELKTTYISDLNPHLDDEIVGVRYYDKNDPNRVYVRRRICSTSDIAYMDIKIKRIIKPTDEMLEHYTFIYDNPQNNKTISQRNKENIEWRDKTIAEKIEKFNHQLFYDKVDNFGSLENKFPANNRWNVEIEPYDTYLKFKYKCR